jgi:hypothetical protein
VIFENNVVLIKPEIAASNKQIYATNGYKTFSKKMVGFLESDNRADFRAKQFVPKNNKQFAGP